MKFFDDPLSLTHPEIASEWSERNHPYTPDDVTAGPHENVWWKGKSCGHEWQTSVGNRCINGTGCPYCSSRKILKGLAGTIGVVAVNIIVGGIIGGFALVFQVLKGTVQTVMGR